MFKVTERIEWGKRTEFNFQGFKDLSDKIRMFAKLLKIKKDKHYRVIIEEVG